MPKVESARALRRCIRLGGLRVKLQRRSQTEEGKCNLDQGRLSDEQIPDVASY